MPNFFFRILGVPLAHFKFPIANKKSENIHSSDVSLYDFFNSINDVLEALFIMQLFFHSLN
jgi:hypothetical protein